MIDMSATAFSRFLRARAAASRSPLPDRAVIPLAARQAGASGDPEPLSPGSPSLPRGSAVEAGRSAMQDQEPSMSASAEWLGRQYAVPIRIGGRVRYTGDRQPQDGTIVSVEGARLRIKLDGQAHVGLYHPTWEIEYLEGEGG